MSEWQPIETAPRDWKTKLIGMDGFGKVQAMSWDHECRRWFVNIDVIYFNPSWWIPHPPEPSD